MFGLLPPLNGTTEVTVEVTVNLHQPAIVCLDRTLSSDVGEVIAHSRQNLFRLYRFLLRSTSIAFRETLVSLAYFCYSDSAVGIATGYALDGQDVEVRVPVGLRIFSASFRPNRFWGPHSLLSNEYGRVFPGGKAAGAWSYTLTSN
jgi:hypothetical protein